MFDEWLAAPAGAVGSEEQPIDVPGRPGAFTGADAVRYRTRFSDPRDPGDDVAVLELRGLYAHAEVEATGDRLDGEWPVEHDAYFRPLRVPFRPFQENELVVTCRSPADRFGGIHDTDAVPAGQRVPGIWWEARLDSRPLPAIDRIDISPEVTADGARLHVETTVLTGGPFSDRITYSVRPAGEMHARGMMERATVETDRAGETTVEHAIDLRDPALWWPRELGAQHRYTVRAKLAGTERTATTGVCTASFEDGALRINGEQVPIRGVNLVTAATADVERAIDVNANLLRAHAHVLPEHVYRVCDREGILVWQDLPLTGPGPFDVERGTELARALDGHCDSHPSVAVYAVHDDPVETFADGLGSGVLSRLAFRFRVRRTDYDPDAAEAIADAFPDDRPVFPAIGGPGVGGDAGSYYPGWDYGDADDVDRLLDRYPAAVLAEYGAGSLARESSGETAGFDAAKHDRRVSGDVADSQAYQAAVVQTVTERLRQRGVGAIAFALRDTDSAGMGVFASDGTPKAGADALARSFEPVQAFLPDPTPGESEVVVVNGTPKNRSLTLEWAAGDRSGAIDVSVGLRGRWTGGPITIPAGAGTVSLALVFEDDRVTNEYDL